MEDPYSAMEGSTEEYSSEENRGKVRWILCKGVTVGRKILVTGFVMSSAPVIVPPLVVISFLGFACSVPYGLLLAGYACTNKLMSMLLPGSKPPPFLLDYGQVSYTDEVVGDDEHGEEEDGWRRGATDMKKEEEEMLEYPRETVEMRIELEENDNDRCIDVANHGVNRKDEIEIVEENGYEEAVEEYEDENEEEPMKLKVEVRIERDGEEEEERPPIVESLDHMPVDDVAAVVVDIEGDEKSGEAIEDMAAPFKVTDIVVELCKSNEVKEDEESVKETSGLLEKIREEGMADKGEKNNQTEEKLSGKAVEENRQVNKNVEEMEMPMEGRISNNPLTNVEKNNDEDVPKADVIPKEGKMVGTTDVCSVKEEEEKPVLNKPFMVQGGGDDNVGKDVIQNVQLNGEKENVTSSNPDVREIADESGFDLFDNRNAAAHSNADYNTIGENEHSSRTCGNPETVDYMAVPVCSGERKCNDAAICSQEDSGMASSKEVYSEEKIWELMEAMWLIVGYKVAPQGTCIEELKRLYLFTGVEPPASFKDPSDLVEVTEKLRLLMSIVGVK